MALLTFRHDELEGHHQESAGQRRDLMANASMSRGIIRADDRFLP